MLHEGGGNARDWYWPVLGDLKHVVDRSTYEKAEQFITAQDSMGFHEFVHKTLSEKEVDTFNDAPPGRKTAFKL